MCEQLPSYFAILTPEVRYNKNLKPIEKIVFAEITALSNLKGYCFATNDYLAKLYDVDSCTISRYISHLEKLSLIRCEYIKEGQIIKERRIYINVVDNSVNGTVDNSVNGTVDNSVNGTVDNSVNGTVDNSVKENNTRVNNTSINNINLPEPRNDLERIEKTYYELWDSLYQKGLVFTEKPIIDYGKVRNIENRLLQNNFSVELIQKAILNSVNHDICIQSGYSLQVILSKNIINQLINGSVQNNQQKKYSGNTKRVRPGLENIEGLVED